jgi:tetratricopeptide (TPR) repeat protein
MSYEWYEKGLPLYMTGHNEDAIPYFDKSLELNPNKNKTWMGKGNALARLGCDQEAISCFDKSLELNPSDVMAKIKSSRYSREIVKPLRSEEKKKALASMPLPNRWMRTCAAKGQLYPQVQNLIQGTQALQGS